MSKLKIKVAAVLLSLAGGQSIAETPVFVCQGDVPTPAYTTAEAALVDGLWQQTLVYLRGFKATLEAPTGCLDSARAVTQTTADTGSSPETECITRYRDVELAIKHVGAILEHPEAARRCFDPQKNYEAFPLYSPNAEMKEASAVAGWLDRPTLSEYYGDRSEGPVTEAGLELASSFADVLSRSVSPDVLSDDVTYNGLPDLWTAVGWIPFYAENEKALNPRFRGGYAYGEVMGPWGMLRIMTIDGESVDLELGMTIQLGGTFYPYHFHHPQEIYLTLTQPDCTVQNEFLVMHWDNPELQQSATDSGWQVNIGPSMGNQFLKTTPAPVDRLTYFERNAIHAFTVSDDCEDTEVAGGLVTVWARTTTRDNDQTTRICSLESSPEEGGRPASRDAHYACDLRHWTP